MTKPWIYRVILGRSLSLSPLDKYLCGGSQDTIAVSSQKTTVFSLKQGFN